MEEVKMIKEIQLLSTAFSELVEKTESLKEIHFGMFYSKGSVSFMNLDELSKNVTEEQKEKFSLIKDLEITEEDLTN